MAPHVAWVCAYILLRRQPPLGTGSADIYYYIYNKYDIMYILLYYITQDRCTSWEAPSATT